MQSHHEKRMWHDVHKKLGLCALAIALLFSGCGKEGDEKNFKVEVVPTEPLIINAKGQICSGAVAVELKKPWFALTFSFQNSTPDVVTVVALRIKATYTAGGANKEFETTLVSANSSVAVCGGTLPIAIVSVPVSGNSTSSPYTWYVEGLDPALDVFNVRFQGEISGWYGPEDNPKDRFRKFFSFSTR